MVGCPDRAYDGRVIEPGTAAGLAKAAWPLIKKLAASDEFARLCARLADRFGDQTGYSAASFAEWRQNDAFMAALAEYLSPPHDFRRDALTAAITPLVGPTEVGGSAEQFAGQVADAIRQEAIQAKEGDDLVRFVLAQLSDCDETLRSTARLFRVPLPRNPLFRGRDELLDRIRQGLRAPGRRIALTQVLAGSGGFGKTQTALEYAYRFAHEYVVVWWISARDEPGIRQGLLGLAHSLGLRCDSEEQGVGACRQWLLDHPAWLLVLDNAIDPELVERYLPTGTGHVITTSRRQDWVNAEVAILDVLGRDDAVWLLMERADDDDPEAAGELAEELGCLPLAVEQAGALIASTSALGLRSYLDLYRRRYVALWGRGHASFYDHTVATTWLLSFESVAGSPAGQLLEACALLDPDGARLGLFEHASADAFPKLADEIARLDAVRDLQRHSLARLSVDHGSLVMHRLIGAQIRAGIDQHTLCTLVGDLSTLLVREVSSGGFYWDRGIADQALSVCRYSMDRAPEAAYALVLALMEKHPHVLTGALLRVGIECADAMAGEGSAQALPLVRSMAERTARQDRMGYAHWLEEILVRQQRHRGPASKEAVLAHLELADAYGAPALRGLDSTRYTAHLELASIILRRRPFESGLRRLHEVQARIAINSYDFPEACRNWWRAFAESENDGARHDVCVAAGRTLVERRRLEHARRFLEQARGLEREGLADAQSPPLLTYVYRSQQRFQELCELCVEQLDEMNASAWVVPPLARGKALDELARARDANGEAEAALEVYLHGVAWFEDACRSSLGAVTRCDQAPETLMRAIEKNPNAARRSISAARNLFAVGITHLLGVRDVQRACQLADGIDSEGDAPAGWIRDSMGLVHVDALIAAERLEDAAAIAKRILADDPQIRAGALLRVAEAYRLAGAVERAVEALLEVWCLDRDFGFPATYLAYGRAYRRLGDEKRARRFIDRALIDRPDDLVRTEILLEQASLLAESGESTRALVTVLDARFLAFEVFGDDAPRVAGVVELAARLGAKPA